eukprot:TRINITY_DN1466_c1_g1_i1.p2 TRINITY_DN1466_c1_g1~~TRINITY_DN1466_c1_g1_i1.p2  ORF type:complete len:93 (+),score=10.45 TRINITY_DN1466_c1_g1_i1:84-362(+)
MRINIQIIVALIVTANAMGWTPPSIPAFNCLKTETAFTPLMHVQRRVNRDQIASKCSTTQQEMERLVQQMPQIVHQETANVEYIAQLGVTLL